MENTITPKQRGKILDQFDKIGLIYHSCNYEIWWDDEKGKYDKKILQREPYKDRIMKTKRDTNKNGCVIFLGANHNNLILVDVDNKEDTIKNYNKICEEKKINTDTFTQTTLNGGYHYIYKLTDKQAKQLEEIKFKSSTAKLFDMHIDIKYTNAMCNSLAAVKIGYNEIAYKIKNKNKPIDLPNIIFNEILRTSKTQKTTVKQNKKEKTQQEIKSENNKNDSMLSLYLDCLNISRFDDRDNWLTIGAIIYNEGGSLKLFDDYSKKSPKYGGVEELWKSFSDKRDKQVTIKKLRLMSFNDDTTANKMHYNKAIRNDIKYLYDELLLNCKADTQYAALFYYYYKDQFIYTGGDRPIWLYCNNYNLWKVDKQLTILGDFLENLKTIITNHINEIRNSEQQQEEQKQEEQQQEDEKITKAKQRLEKLKQQAKEKEDAKNNKDFAKKIKLINERLSSNKNKKSIINELCRLFEKRDIAEKLNNINKNVFAFENCVYDLDTCEYRKAKREEYLTVSTGYEYTSVDNKYIDRVKNILESIQPNKETLNYLLKSLAVSLSGCPSEHFYLWLGKGGNGKSILDKMIKKTLGAYCDAMEISYFTKGNYVKAGGANPEMAEKRYKRLIITSEPDAGEKLKGTEIKKISGGDIIKARELYSGEIIGFRPQFQMIIMSNNAIDISGTDGGIVRRFRLIEFPIKFVDNPKNINEKKKDRNLESEIDNEKYGIALFEILKNYYTMYKKEGLDMPEEVKKPTEEYVSDSDPLQMFLEEHFEITTNNNDKIRSKDIYEMYKGQNKKKEITQTQFSLEMKHKGFKFIKSSVMYVTCIKYKEADNIDLLI